MTMNRKLAFALASAGIVVASATHAESFGDQARVISSHPVVEQIPVTREQCWNEHQSGYVDQRVTRSDTGATIGAGTVLGAVVGGVIGHQFGNSSGGRDRGTAAGAIVGGLVGNQIDRDNAGPPATTTEVERIPVEREVKRCRTVNEVREATVGYDVRYEYHGRVFTTRMPYLPGRTIPVSVEVQPVSDAPPPPPPPPPRPYYH
jgi:uncharacterized protein YcfJ